MYLSGALEIDGDLMARRGVAMETGRQGGRRQPDGGVRGRGGTTDIWWRLDGSGIDSGTGDPVTMEDRQTMARRAEETAMRRVGQLEQRDGDGTVRARGLRGDRGVWRGEGARRDLGAAQGISDGRGDRRWGRGFAHGQDEAMARQRCDGDSVLYFR
ncbi:hypothetical protein E2562_036616 [Oryza meyeriana var. granulata]|uniref:DUF834 domain-containing protein n=1 Tax=Oryza meyeriana var. granulata TaxID=110450 RepID=A0A6G1BQP7_9ORYZ|nr:hypothetical protein E2562_036616 [Oryza meyeriana var. granulata]